MQFAIQVGHPTILYPETRPAPDLAYAIEELFPMDTEELILHWNNIPVRIGYKYELSVLIDDLLPLLSAILRTDQGRYKVAWDDPSFSAYWFLAWDKDQMTIEAEWHSVAGDYEALLNNHNCVKISKDAFLAEWKGLLSKLIQAINLTDLQIEVREELETLYQIQAAIPEFGVLYQSQNKKVVLPIIQSFPFSSSSSSQQEVNGYLEHEPKFINTSTLQAEVAVV